MKRAAIAFVIGLLLGAVVCGSIVYNKMSVPTPQPIHDTLQVVLKELQVKIDTIYLEKTKLKYVYEQKAETIWNQSSNADWEYYNNFLRSRFPSDTVTVKAN